MYLLNGVKFRQTRREILDFVLMLVGTVFQKLKETGGLLQI